MAILLHLKGSLVETLHGSPVPVGHYDVNQDGSSVCWKAVAAFAACSAV